MFETLKETVKLKIKFPIIIIIYINIFPFKAYNGLWKEQKYVILPFLPTYELLPNYGVFTI